MNCASATRNSRLLFGLAGSVEKVDGACDEDEIDMQAVLAGLVTQDTRCFYTMMDACLRCPASIFQGGARFMHPSAATVLNRQQAARESNTSSSSKAPAEGHDSSSTTTSGSPGTWAAGGLLDSWKQTQAYLSALLSYRKVMQLLWDSTPAFDLRQWYRGLKDALQWFVEEGVLDALGEPGAAHGKKSSSTDAAGARGGKAKAVVSSRSSSSADSAEATTADPEEAAACRLLALCVLSRVLITFCQHLAGADGSKGSSSRPASGAGGGASVSTNVAVLAEQLQRIEFTQGRMATLLQLGCSLGVACYCLGKQVQQFGSSSSGNSSKGGSSSCTREGGSKGSSSKGKGEGESFATASKTNSSNSSSPKWGGLQLELPPSVVNCLQDFQGWVPHGVLQGEYGLVPATSSKKMVLPPGKSILVLGSPDNGAVEAIDVLEQLLLLCEGVVAAVPVPLGCNNPSCINLDGVSEACAAKVCSGCKKAHYCGTACVKAHWKEHKPYCK